MLNSTTTDRGPMSPTTKIVLLVIGLLFVLGALMQAGEKSAFCRDHPGGRGFKTLDDKYKWVTECNNGKPAPRP